VKIATPSFLKTVRPSLSARAKVRRPRWTSSSERLNSGRLTKSGQTSIVHDSPRRYPAFLRPWPRSRRAWPDVEKGARATGREVRV
jgi:hypothetical protein